jgi:hypothetical protein
LGQKVSSKRESDRTRKARAKKLLDRSTTWARALVIA